MYPSAQDKSLIQGPSLGHLQASGSAMPRPRAQEGIQELSSC